MVYEEAGTAIVAANQKAVVQWKGVAVTITFHDVKRLLCPLAADQEVVIFLKTCQSLQLNPFAGECYLIKYALEDKAATVVAIDAYLKAAEVNEHYDGCEAGIILKNAIAQLEFREGAFLLEEERSKLVGGWAKVYRNDRSRPTYVAVNKIECIKLTREGHTTKFWTEPKQPWMLRKTALKRALVEAFPSLFAGTLSTAEVGGDIEGEYREVEGELPRALEKKGKPNWRKFWIKVTDELGLTEEQAHALLNVKSIKKELIDKGWTMEQMWTGLLQGVRGQQAGAAPATGEIVTAEEELFGEAEPGDTPEPGDTSETGETRAGPGPAHPNRPPSPANPKRDPNSIKSINELLRVCYDDWDMQPAEVYKELNVTSASQITETPPACYIRIAAARGVE